MKIAVIGAGKMGSWLASELTKTNQVAVYDNDNSKAKSVADAVVLDSLEQLMQFKPELLINAVSLQHTVSAFEEIVKHLPKETVISDIASIKGNVSEFYKKSGFRFVSTHPMFGPTHARMNMLAGQNAIIINESDKQIAEFFRIFYSGLGLGVFDYSFDEHDKMMAYSLSTPFSASLVFAACVDKTAVPGTNFAKHMALAKGLLGEDDHLLAEVLFNKYSLPELEKITNKIEFLKHVIKAKDFEEAKRFFDKLRKNIGE
ncbi:prephenate dehydrogenase [Candidatus Micrarchaeota archaeon]|nr:prephenate dehydrogenase [Candidatus Micrarchaeota archaeon]